LRDALYSIPNPVRNQLAMERTVAREEGATAGLTHMTFDLGGAFGAGLAGVLIDPSSAEASSGVDIARFVPAFTMAVLLVVFVAGLYYVFFRDWNERRSQANESALESVFRPVEEG
jgi:predicted MFS family arabinose efflux permease